MVFIFMNAKRMALTTALILGSMTFSVHADKVLAEPIGTSYSVQKGDNLYRIALNHNVSLEELTSVNNTSKGVPIRPGQKLVIPKSIKHESVSVYGSELTAAQYDTLLAIVQQESGGTDYAATLAVVSVMTNRVDTGLYGGKTIWEVATAPGQFEAYGAGHYQRHTGNITETTRSAVKDGLSGKKNVSYLNFWTDEYAYARGVYGVNIGGNVFFNM